MAIDSLNHLLLLSLASGRSLTFKSLASLLSHSVHHHLILLLTHSVITRLL